MTVAVSTLRDKDPHWIITIFLGGPGPVPDDPDRAESYKHHYLRFTYILKKSNCPGKALMREHSNHILDFYTTLRDEHVTKYYDMYAYGFNHPEGDTENAIWLFGNIYWAERDAGRLDLLTIMPMAKTIRITLNVMYEDLFGNEWIYRDSDDSEDSKLSICSSDILNHSFSSYQSSRSDHDYPDKGTETTSGKPLPYKKVHTHRFKPFLL